VQAVLYIANTHQTLKPFKASHRRADIILLVNTVGSCVASVTIIMYSFKLSAVINTSTATTGLITANLDLVRRQNSLSVVLN